MIQFFKELFEYSHYFNQELITVFTEQPALTSEKAVKLFNHILNAHQVWNSRIMQAQNSFGVWDIHSVHELKEIDRVNHTNSISILDNFDLNSSLKYTNSKGQALLIL